MFVRPLWGGWTGISADGACQIQPSCCWEEEVSNQKMTEQITSKKVEQRVIPEHSSRSQGSKEGEV